VARELRARVKSTLDRAGIVPGPDTILITAPERGPLGEAGPPGEAEAASPEAPADPEAPVEPEPSS
jgi:hypothetical protein